MTTHELIELFAGRSPVCVMTRATLEQILSDERPNRIFEETVVRHYCRELAFAARVQLTTMVVARIRPSANAACKSVAAKVAVSVNSVDNKLQGIEPAVSESLVRETAADMAAAIDQLGAAVEGPVGGRELRILDNNHLAGTEHVMRELRRLARHANLALSTTHKWSPKRPQPNRLSGHRGNHVSPQSILQQRKRS